MKNFRIKRLILAGELAAASFILMRFTEFPIFAAASFLKTDLGDIPLLIGAIFLGPLYGIVISFTKNLLFLAFGGGSGGIIGAFMNFLATGSFAFCAGLIAYKTRKIPMVLIALLVGTVAMVAVMVFANLIITPIFLKAPREVVIKMLVPIIIPFNLLKGIISTAITFPLYLALKKYINFEPN